MPLLARCFLILPMMSRRLMSYWINYKRLALPNSRILIHQPATEGGYGQSSDIEIQAREILRIRSLMEEMLSGDTGKSVEEVSRDIERDKYLTAEQSGVNRRIIASVR